MAKLNRAKYRMSLLLIGLGFFLVNGQLATARSICIDQIGYLSDAPKFVFVSQSADSFYVKESPSGVIAFRGSLNLWQTNDPATGLTLYRGDFTSLNRAGNYFITVTDLGDSYEFMIADTVYNEVYRRAFKGFYFQRCGMNLESAFASDWAHDKCHQGDANFHVTAGSSGFRETKGGWHDAGDYGKYVVNAGISVGTLLKTYEWFPDRFDRDDLFLPESNNGVPDLLDEIRYELDWLLKMQDSSGGVFFKVTGERFEGFIMPQNDMNNRLIYQISTTATADFAAMFANAARVYPPFDSTFAQTCLWAAENAWRYLEAHPNIVPENGFHNPTGTNTGSYGDSQDWDERLWAAAELFATTGKTSYHNYYKEHYNLYNIFAAPMSWTNVQNLAHLTYLMSKQVGIDLIVRTSLRSALIAYCQEQVARANQNGFLVLLDPGEYNWGCNSVALNKAMLLIAGYLETKNLEFYRTALDQLHYILGVNAQALSFVTGVGDHSVRYPHHRPSGADGIQMPVPGLLVGGPNQFLQDTVLRGRFTTATPPALCYVDDVGSFSCNENCINWNAPLVFVSGFFSQVQHDYNGGNHSGAILPDQIQLFQNYPNPFNDKTYIDFRLISQQAVQVFICDVLGQNVRNEGLGHLPVGRNCYIWDGRDQAGKWLGSGIYFYYLAGMGQSEKRKLVYLK